ncbi:MAG: 50S ribosomal protein L23 [Alphaproteobacteria bacterium]
MSKSEVKKNVTERMYDVIRRPVITEKSMKASEHNKVTFIVPLDAEKTEVKSAVETVFGVKVESVNTVTTKGKLKRFRGHMGKRSDFKKAVVRLADGQNIDVTTGI